MARPTKQSKIWDFNVEAQPLHLPDGSPSGWFGNVRTDTKQVLGATTEHYGILQNRELLDAAREALTKRGYVNPEESIIVGGDGQSLYAEFTFKDKVIPVTGANVGDVIGYKLRLQNSFDRTMRASWAMGFLRLACLNGMVTLDKEFTMTAKHSSKINLKFLGDALDKAISGFGPASEIFGHMAQRPITMEQGTLILGNLTRNKFLSETLRENIELLWKAPKRKEDEERNLWNLYNAVTEYLTHKVAPERYEYALRTETGVLHQLKKALASASIMHSLLLPIEPGKTVEVEVTSAPVTEPATV